MTLSSSSGGGESGAGGRSLRKPFSFLSPRRGSVELRRLSLHRPKPTSTPKQSSESLASAASSTSSTPNSPAQADAVHFSSSLSTFPSCKEESSNSFALPENGNEMNQSKRSEPAKETKSILKRFSASRRTSGISTAHRASRRSSRSVKFNLRKNEYHPDVYTLNDYEWRVCWWNDHELRSFKKNQMKAVKRFFAKAEKAERPPRRRLSRLSTGSATTTKDNSKDNWRSVMSNAYQECRKVKKGDLDTLTGQVDRDQLRSCFQDHPDLVGLETYILFALRGSVSDQIQKILYYYQDSVDRMGTNDYHAVLAQTTQKLTKPGSVFVHEIAMAQAAALSESQAA